MSFGPMFMVCSGPASVRIPAALQRTSTTAAEHSTAHRWCAARASPSRCGGNQSANQRQARQHQRHKHHSQRPREQQLRCSKCGSLQLLQLPRLDQQPLLPPPAASAATSSCQLPVWAHAAGGHQEAGRLWLLPPSPLHSSLEAE